MAYLPTKAALESGIRLVCYLPPPALVCNTPPSHPPKTRSSPPHPHIRRTLACVPRPTPSPFCPPKTHPGLQPELREAELPALKRRAQAPHLQGAVTGFKGHRV